MIEIYYGQFTEEVFNLAVSVPDLTAFQDIQTLVECTVVTLQELG